ncbi:MAG: tRNA 2-thiocytidine biosynthesis TtcA family protein [Syntrophomonadaceae bacterium]|jgi:tRNA 2-thiocytidine biosynthesis protein TtcA
MGKKNEKLIFKKVRDANLKYNLIENGDKIAVGLSGGKDSITMLYFLCLLKKYTPLEFELLPIVVDLGWENDNSHLTDLCASLDLPILVEKTNIGHIVFKAREETNPCSLCANLRRGALNRVAKNNGCNKVALGHHLDDVVNTLFLSMLFEGRFNVFKPKTYLDRTDLTVIRPLIYVEEKHIRTFIKEYSFPPIINKCPADGKTRRSEIAELLNTIEARYPNARKNFLSSIENVGPDCFWHS